MGTLHQMPTTPMAGMADKMYARATRVPREMTVSTKLMPGRSMARYRPYSKNRMPIPK